MVEPEVRGVGHSWRACTVDTGLPYARQDALFQPVAQCGEPSRSIAREEGHRHLCGMAQADDPWQVLRARAALPLLRAAEEEGHRVCAAADVKRACALRAVELVARDGQQVAADRLHV